MTEQSTPLAIVNGRVIDPVSGIDGLADVVIEDGYVTHLGVGASKITPAATKINATGLIVSPGFVDLHTHLRTPGQEHKETIETGAAAAAAGGFTTICQMPNTDPALDSQDRVTQAHNRASDSLVRVLTVGAITKGRAGQELVSFDELASAGVVAFSDDGDFVEDTALMTDGYHRAAILRLPISQHCESPVLVDGGVVHRGMVASQLGVAGRPAEGEDTAVAREIALATLTGGHAHIQHVSTAGAVNLIRDAKERGVWVTAEVTPHHLVLTDHALLDVQPPEAYNTNAKCNPPLREESDVAACVAGLVDGTIDAIATDHAPHSPQEKTLSLTDAPAGMIGLETALPYVMRVINAGEIQLASAIERLTLGPVRAWHLDEQLTLPGLGTLAIGAPGDVALIDPDAKWRVEVDTLCSRSQNTPLLGQQVIGRVVATVASGVLVHDLRGRDNRISES